MVTYVLIAQRPFIAMFIAMCGCLRRAAKVASDRLDSFGQDSARLAYSSHPRALEHTSISIFEYRILSGYVIVDVPETKNDYEKRNDCPTSEQNWLQLENAARTEKGYA